jgi:hypothetical protein
MNKDVGSTEQILQSSRTDPQVFGVVAASQLLKEVRVLRLDVINPYTVLLKDIVDVFVNSIVSPVAVAVDESLRQRR